MLTQQFLKIVSDLSGRIEQERAVPQLPQVMIGKAVIERFFVSPANLLS
jgi:hypothetical protein